MEMITFILWFLCGWFLGVFITEAYHKYYKRVCTLGVDWEKRKFIERRLRRCRWEAMTSRATWIYFNEDNEEIGRVFKIDSRFMYEFRHQHNPETFPMRRIYNTKKDAMEEFTKVWGNHLYNNRKNREENGK